MNDSKMAGCCAGHKAQAPARVPLAERCGGSKTEVLKRTLLAGLFAGLMAFALSLVLAAGPDGVAYAEAPSGDAALAVGQGATDAGAANAGAAETQPATQTVEQKLANVNLNVRAKLQKDGWKPVAKSGKTAGSTGSQGLRMIRVKLTGLNGVSGAVRYKAYVPGSGWTKLAKNNKACGSNKRAITAVRVSLKGTVSKYYDVYYRTRIKGFGWLGWAKNSQISGTTGSFSYATAVQVKLVKKGAKFNGVTAQRYAKTRWPLIERKYLGNKDVRQILEVKHQGGSRAKVVLRTKKAGKWKTIVSCRGYVGSRGVGPTREGLSRTPSGDYGITQAFGIKDDPGARLDYVHVTSSMYWCADRSHYNELIDINEYPHDCNGEHLIDYSPHYNYGLFFDYNTDPVRYGRGSAFFVHCTGGTPYTAGCIAVSQQNMIKIICNVSDGARICIY